MSFSKMQSPFFVLCPKWKRPFYFSALQSAGAGPTTKAKLPTLPAIPAFSKLLSQTLKRAFTKYFPSTQSTTFQLDIEVAETV